MSFSQGISGLAVAATNLDIIGNNISNAGTIGFKSAAATFQDIYAGSRVGLGASVSGVVQNFSQGVTQTSSRPLDTAILNGNGFFRLTSPSGEVAYSRNGQFTRDKNGFLTNAQGLQVTGFGVNAAGNVMGGAPAPIVIPFNSMSPKATTAIEAKFNLDARLQPPTKTPVNLTDSDTYSYSNSIGPIYDSLGNPHEVAAMFVKLAAPANTWDVYGTADNVALNGGAPLTTVTFDTNGNLTAPATGTFALPVLALTNGAAPLAATVDLSGTTQVGTANDMLDRNQDGYTAGTLTAYAINPDGTITGKFSNDQTQLLGQIVLATFANPNGLEPKGDNVWAETAESGQALTGVPGEGTKQGSLQSGALESSNVDLTSELVNLIVAQRNYQANVQTVKTQDQVTQSLMNIR